ncbi:MAG: hypothetical protein ACXQTD_05725 [Candidatus Syntropharchaeia archaeon]
MMTEKDSSFCYGRLVRSIVVAILFIFLVPLCGGEDVTLGEVKEAIKEKGAKWTAGKTSVSNLPSEKKEMLKGLRFAPRSENAPVTSPPRGFGAILQILAL